MDPLRPSSYIKLRVDEPSDGDAESPADIRLAGLYRLVKTLTRICGLLFGLVVVLLFAQLLGPALHLPLPSSCPSSQAEGTVGHYDFLQGPQC